MSSSISSLSEEIQCSICLEVFTDPATTPCGHNFCKICLNKCWNNSQTCSCPYCKETFKQRPDLKINTTLRELVDHYKKKSPEKTAEVLCDICEERKLKALKSCLVCQSSYCETHLERHLRVTCLKKHKLMDPVSNLEDYICQKHERPLDLFCRDDQTCVCSICSVKDHKNHNTVPIEEESEQKKSELMKTQRDVQQTIQNRIKKIQEIKHSAEARKGCYTELLEMMEEQQKAAEKQEQELIEELEQEITELKMRNTELEQLSHTEDHLHLLQIHSSLCSPRNTRNWPEISMKTHESLETLRRALNQLKDTIDDKLTQTVSTELKWMQQYAVDVTLDPDTAHPNLILSDDGKQVRHGDIRQKLPDKPERFDTCACVLGKEGFFSGRFYFEVQVKGKTKWTLGVARESINRKGQITLSPSDGCWTVILRNGDEYKACDDPRVSLSLRVKPQRVGVFVDYEEGLVSFYDVESSSHIYSFTAQSFTEKLYPYFSPCFNDGGKNSSPLIITPVNYNK
ncbi:E3 ubiquitin-protein ligase TRIM39-like [Onychostoma macrolepis]|uniref:E3 ubiquitin-protein ligase TRIM39-like n=1 Tax=Onychostoma macrolepis TaxID=369639 RepID=UPI00272A6CC8|nr:E3 ubiquitin-protein ligase TRIM39-like [Onychostoma macrolepis]